MDGSNQIIERSPVKPFKKEIRQDASLGKKGFFNWVTSVSLTILLLILWQIVSVLNVFPPMIIPSLESVVTNFAEQINNGILLSDLSVSLSRVLRGYLFGCLIGLSVGVLMGVSSFANRFLSGILDGIRQVPGLAWFPIIILWFGVGDLSKIVLIAKGAFFPVLLNTIDGIHNTDKGYLEVAHLYGVKKFDLIKNVYFPSAVPFVFVGLRLGISMAWMSVVAAEMLASSEGLGYRISNAQQLMRASELIVDMIVIGVVGWLLDRLLRVLSNHILKWKNNK